MEEEPTDPYEQQLLAVFKSCLAEGRSQLDKNGLLVLCKKLELDVNHRDAILELLNIDTTQKFISFYEFRNKFLQLLGKYQEGPDSPEMDINGESLILSERKMNKKPIGTMNSGEQQNDNTFGRRRWQETWSNQNSLLCDDVNSFCSKGPTLPKQAIELIFEKLDIDCDGLINLEEFSHFFQSYNNNKLQEQSNTNWSTHLMRDATKSNCNKDFVHYHAGRQVLRNVIVELWELAGVWEANSLLNTLGFDSAMISLTDLLNALSSELKLHRDMSAKGDSVEFIRLLKGALSLYQEEVRNLNSSLEHLSCERDKLRTDIIEANDRANLLASDVDEHQTRLEKNYQEQICQLEAKHVEALKELSNQLHSEREKNSSSLKSLEDQLQLAQQEELRIRNELSSVLEELKQLEQENRNQNDEIVKLEACNSQLSIQIQELAAAHAQVESIETKENEQVSDFMAHIKRLHEEMKILRDHNDELTSELEMLKHRDNDAKSVVSSVDVRSTISDENDGVVSMPTTEVSDTEDEDKQQSKLPADQSKINKTSDMMRNRINFEDSSNGNSINKLTEIIQEFRNFLTSAKFCAECSILRNEVSCLISELELYQSSVPVNTPLPAPNKKKKQLRNLANELEAESRCVLQPTETYRDSVFTKTDRVKHYKRISSSDDTIHDLLDDNIDDYCIKAMKNKLTGFRDYTPRKEMKNNNKKGIINNLDSKKLNFQSRDSLKSEDSRFAIERKLLLERCNDLEKSLELLRSEYEQCEDYWASKLDEERQLFEQEQKISDEKFTELIEKMAEYEEQFNTNDKHGGRLSPIEETSGLESQYNNLEEEFERWKLEAQEEMERKTKEIEELKEKLENGKKLSLADISVQFPDKDDPPNKYPELYNVLCSSSGSGEGGSDKVDFTVHPEAKNYTQQCDQCHKPVTQITSNCCDKRHLQHQQQDQKKVHGKGEGKGNKRHRRHQNKLDGDVEYKNMLKQKEKLKQEIIKLQNIKVMNAYHMYPMAGTEEQNIFSNLYAKLHAQEHRLKYMQFVSQAQQKEGQRAMHAMWKQHVAETNNLHCIIKSTEDKLNQQIKINKELNEKLMKGDLLTKELFVENSQNLETIKRLEQHCQILTESRIESTLI
ncbi:blastoderm-specific protein 25D [Phymastichus coffea]|uniref:blastoderm-specific protein 25D n=1 Tax=Phymastichus coffea TaxID=108790 RepID=UPI00273BAEB5|nr:blastoderm-specific protein 25D [Phymastichus coffea]